MRTHTPLHTHLSCSSCIVFRLTGVQEKSRSHRVAGVARDSGMSSSLALSCNIRLFVIELDYGYRYLLEVCYELSDIWFLIQLRYCSMLALHDRPVLEMVSLLSLKLYQLLQYSYDCSSVMYVHPEGGGSVRDTRVSLLVQTWCLDQLRVAGCQLYPWFVKVAGRW